MLIPKCKIIAYTEEEVSSKPNSRTCNLVPYEMFSYKS
jgi:hypothetical protein